MTEQYKQQVQTWRAYAPGVDEVMSPPLAPIEMEAQEPSPNSQQTQAGLIVIVAANLAVTAIIILVMLYNNEQVKSAQQALSHCGIQAKSPAGRRGISVFSPL